MNGGNNKKLNKNLNNPDGESGKKVKNLINGLAAIPNPFFLASEFLFAEYPRLKRYLDLEKNIGKIDMRLFEDGNYDGIELVLWGMFDEDWNIREKRLEKYLKCKVSFDTFHACFEGISSRFKTVYLNLAERCDKSTKKAIRSHIEAASALQKGKTLIVFHPGKIKHKSDKEKALGNIINNIGDSIDYARKKNIVICIENMSWGWGSSKFSFCNNHKDFKYILEKVNNPNLKVTFDWGHLNSCLVDKEFREYYYKNSNDFSDFRHIKDFVDSLGKDIIHAHIHYNRSHFNKSTNFREGALKKIVIYLFFWTNLSKFVRRGSNKSFYDEHLTLNRITDEYFEGYKNSILNLLERSSIRENGFITHEFAPRRVFKVFTYSKAGAEYKDYIESLKIFNKIINKKG